MSDIRVNFFKDYRVDRNPKIARKVDSEVEKEWWNNEGWSDMYGMEVEEFKDKFPNANFLGSGGVMNRVGSFMMKMNNTKNYQKLENVFNFIKNKDGYANPMDSEKEMKEMMKPGVLYPGKQGFGFVKPLPPSLKNRINAPFFVPYPASNNYLQNVGLEDNSNEGFYIKDIKEGGVFVWNDELENRFIGTSDEAKYEDGDEIV